MYSSTAQWAFGIGVSAWATASMEDIFTRCCTPAATARSVNCFSWASWFLPFGRVRKAFSAPFSARFTVSASATSPTTSSTPAAFRSAALASLRTMARSFAPLASSCLAVSPPVLPVTPVSRITRFLQNVGRNGAYPGMSVPVAWTNPSG